MLIILAFLVLIPNSKHLHLILSPVTVFLKSPVLGTVPNLDFEKEQVGLETVKDLPSKAVLDAFTCVECGRCQDNCPAFGTGKRLNPKTIILQNEDALLAGERDKKLVDVYDEGVLVAVHHMRRLRAGVSGRRRAPADHHRRAARSGVQRRGAGVPDAALHQPRTPRRTSGA